MNDNLTFLMVVIAVTLMSLRIVELNNNNYKKQNRINELENKVEDQYYLIDALKQQEG